MSARERLERMAAGWRRRRLAGLAAAALAAAALVALGVGTALGWPAPMRAGGAFAALVAVAIAGAMQVRRRPVDARTVARHLDRVHPELEESTELLLADEAALGPLERLQHARTAAALDRIPTLSLPHRALRRSLVAAGCMLVATGALALAGPSRAGAAAASPGATLRAAPGVSPRAPRLTGLAIEVSPPAYTGRPRRRTDRPDLEVEHGARVVWRVRTDRPAPALLVTADGDTVRFAGDSAALVASRTLLYTIALVDSATGGWRSELAQLVVRADQPPTLAVLAPPARTLLAPGEALRVPVRVVAEDDYGLGPVELVATVTTGRGEGIKFREQTLAFAERRARANGAELRTVLDLAALGLAPGDELYFHVRATDRRVPVPNEARSETFFVTLLDTARIAEAELAGLPVNRLPEYFRSQRQIIIDTERLLAERPRLAAETFRDRSNAIGIDQGLLRIRYGEAVGDETEGGGDDAEGHMHDSEENATLLAQSVKSLLKRALAEMWQAELKLRTYEPEAALPYEYRALALLKEVQQAARVYVQRVGFEPPPLEPDRKRLSGDLEGAATRRVARELRTEPALPAVRAALPLVEALRADSADLRTRERARIALEAAGRELATLAVAEPGRHLDALRAVRALSDALAGGAPCAGCVERAARGLWEALPPAPPAPAPATGAAGAAGVARRYFDRLTAP